MGKSSNESKSSNETSIDMPTVKETAPAMQDLVQYVKIPFVEMNNEKSKFMALAEIVGNIRLIGETGTGKSFLVHDVCEEKGWELREYSMTQETTRYDLLVERVLEAQKIGDTVVATSAIIKGIVLLWLESQPTDTNKSVMFLDEWNYSRPEIKTFVNQLSDFRHSIWVPETQKTYTRTKNHIFVIAMNPHEKVSYGGTVEENIAQIRRFESIRLYWLPINEEVKILQQFNPKEYAFNRRLVEFARKIRNNYKEGNITTVLTTQNLINYTLLHKADKLEEREIITIAADMFIEEERKGVIDMWEDAAAATEAKKAIKEKD